MTEHPTTFFSSASLPRTTPRGPRSLAVNVELEGSQMSVKIKKGDTVKVIAGKDKGAEGKVIQVLREEQRVIVEGVNRVKKHTKVVNQGGRDGNTGGIVTAEAPIHISNVMVVDGKGTTRLGSKRVETTKRRSDGSTYAAERSVRISRKSGEEI